VPRRKLRQYDADGNTTECNRVRKWSYSNEANDANRICDEYYLRDIDYAVLLVVGACIIAGVTN